MRIAASIVVFLLALSLSAQDFEVAVTTIRVWVAAEGKSAGVLTQNDFEILEDGKKVQSTCFEGSRPLSTPEPDPEDGEMEELTRKRVVLMIDQLNTSQNEYLFIKPKLQEFLEQMDGKAEVMLVALPPYEEVTSFTRNFDEVRFKLERLACTRDRDQRVANRRRDIREAIESRRKDAMAIAYRVALEAEYEESQEVLLVLDALKSFHKSLSEQDQADHTVVIFVSGGLNAYPGQQYRDMVEKAYGMTDEGFREMQRASIDTGKTIQTALGMLNRDNVTVYTISTRGQVEIVDNIIESNKRFLADSRDYEKDYQELLNRIAQDTGGLSFKNSLNFKKGFDSILVDLDQQYLLCYVAPEHKKQGQYHKIKVTTKAKGIKLRHRAGYLD